MTNLALLEEIDAYLDAVPRSAARVESVGSLTLFIREGPGWPYYARPTPGAGPVRPKDVRAARARQRALGIPETFEWVDELSPEMERATAATGLQVRQHPLMHLAQGRLRPSDPPEGFAIRLIEPGDDLPLVFAVPAMAFASPGAAPEEAGAEALREAAAAAPAEAAAIARDRLNRGLTLTVAAFAGDLPVAVGSHQPVASTTEVVGVGVLPAFRRRGLAAAVTSALVADALRNRKVSRVFLSAGDLEIARVYERLGFEIVGTAGEAEPPETGRPEAVIPA